ncbi:MAG: 4-alpha-glucanotransferase [Acidobacteria bacterium]|nr:4-alpha-glucanotransferase [Acidobacteriota bacterium]
MTRTSGISVPLFSLVSSRSWGVGEFPDFAEMARWAADAGQAVVQILPILELPDDERSPYSALTSFALDPTCIALPALLDFEAIGGELAFDFEDRLSLDEVMGAPRVMYREVRRLKHKWLRRAWQRFVDLEIARGTPRARQFELFCAREAWWLDEYATFRAVLQAERNRGWWEWDPELRPGSTDVMARAAAEHQAEVAYRKYLQWVADAQWSEARRLAWPTRVFGDLPFMISANSADVWRRQEQFRLDATVGAPPDAFAPEGQDWGLPPWRWRALAETNYKWMRLRARRYADLFDGFRIDHLVGLYRTWVRPLDKAIAPHFEPSDEADQRALGGALVGVFVGSGAEVVAEDLGTVPAFVRESITALGVPGFKVMRWERHWDQPGEPFIDPKSYPELSVATTGTHDIDPLAVELGPEAVEEAVRALLDSGSYLSLIPLQDVFGWTDRINTPSVVNETNWTWRVPRPVDTWSTWPEGVARRERLRTMTRAAGR